MSSSSSSSRNWRYDVFPSFRGEDVRKTFLSHFLKELDRKLISAFKDDKIEKSQSLDPVLKLAIKDSRIAIVVLSKKYASSSWCLNELLEIVKCKNESGQIVIPIFYDLDPSHVRKQTGDFGKIFDETCHNKTKIEIRLWRKALTDVAKLVGFHSQNCDNEAKLIEDIVIDILDKLKLNPSKDFDDFVGIEDHIAEMSLMLDLKSEQVRTIGIWGPSGIGKTTIARALFSRLSRHFQGRIFIDMRFISKSTKDYSKGNSTDYNMMLHLQENFLSEILDKEGIKVDDLGAVRGRLKHHKVLIIIDDLDDQVVLDALAGGDEWFGPGSRIIAITKNKHILRAHGIKYIYEVGYPSEEVALQMFCQSAFRQNSPPDDYMELASEVAERAGGLPLGLNILGSSMRGRNKKFWEDMLPTLRKGLDGKIEKALRVSYDGLERKEYQALFRHIACFFNGYEIDNIKLMLANSDLNVDTGLEILVDKSLIHVMPSLERNFIEMHCLVEEMGKEIVRGQSKKPGKREFLMDSENVCEILEDGTGSRTVLGISLNIDEIDELRIHKKAFKKMRNLKFLNIYTNTLGGKKETRWHLPEGFDYLPPKLKLLSWEKYPLRYMPSNFRPENLVKLQMQHSNLEKLWEGVHSFSGLKNMDLWGSNNLKKIPNLSMATSLETLNLGSCSSLVELPSSIQYLNKLTDLNMSYCDNLEILPTGINLKSLYYLNLRECPRLKSFPDISTNISSLDIGESAIEELPPNMRLENLVSLQMFRMKSEKLWERVQPLTSLMTMLSPALRTMWISDIPSLVELPSSIHNLCNLKKLHITECKNLESLPANVNLEFLDRLDLSGCSRLRSFPDISTNISWLNLAKTGVEEVPWWIKNFYWLQYLYMNECNSLQCISVNICKLKHLEIVNFAYCEALTEARMNDSPSAFAMATYNIHYELQVFDEPSSSLQDNYIPKLDLNFRNSFKMDPEALLHQQSFFKEIVLPGEEVPSYFTHRTLGTSSLTSIPMPHTSPSQPFFKMRACAVVDLVAPIFIQLCCRFIGRLGNHFDSTYEKESLWIDQNASHLIIFDCLFPLNKDTCHITEMSYDQVDIKFRLTGGCRLKGWGIRLFEDYETDQSEEYGDSDIGNETDQSEEFGDSDDTDIGNETDQSEEFGYSDDSDIGNNTDYNEEFEDSDDSDSQDFSSPENILGNPSILPHVFEANEDHMFDDGCLENEHRGECEGNDVETERSSKRMRIT